MTLRHQNRSRTTWTGTYGQEFCSAISASLSLFPHNAGNALPTASKLTCLLVDWLFYRHESPFRSPFSSIYHQLIVYPCLPETSATEFLWWHVFELEWCPTFLSFFWRSLGNDDFGIQYICCIEKVLTSTSICTYVTRSFALRIADCKLLVLRALSRNVHFFWGTF